MKKYLLMTMMMLLWACYSWGQTITIGAGTSAQRQPFGVYFGYERSAAIYTSAEIGSTGTISHLGWYVGTAAVTNVPLKIYLKTNTSTALTADTWANMIAGATEVYSGTLQFTPTGWMTIDITDFSYSSNNLLVLCETNFTGGGTGTYPYFRYSTAGTAQHEYWYQDNTAPTTNGNLNTLRPNIQMTLVPQNMSFTSATTLTASTNPVTLGSTNQPVIALQVVTNGTLLPFGVTSIGFSTSGTTSASDLTAAKVYYTSTPTFSTADQFGSTVTNPSGSFTVTGSKTLNGGNNYFWLCYDISNTATNYNIVDGTCTQFITTEPQTHIPTITAPTGSRPIRTALSGTYTIDNTLPTAGTNYNSFTDAINDLNSLPLAGPVIYNVTAGQTFTKTVGASPYNYAYSISYIGTAVNTITFQKFGAGSNPVINITGASATNDIGMFIFGTDYLTFNGININDAGTTSADYLEYGYYLQGPADDNCKYVTIQNCTIDLNKSNVSSKGIYFYSNAPTSSANGNSYNTITGNTIQDAWNGIYISGNSTYPDLSNVITGNTIQTIGDNTLTTSIYPFYASYQSGINISNNIINNITIGAGYIYGLYCYSFLGTNTISGNTLSNFTGAYYVYGMYLSSLDGSNTISGNTVSNLTGSAAYTMYGLYYSPASTANAQISGNSIFALDNKYTVYGLYVSSGTTNNIFKNKIYNVAYTGTSTYIAYGLSSSGGTTNNINNNFIYDIKAPASTGTPGTRALNFSSGTTANVYYNTVYLDYVSTVATNQSAALYITTSPTALNMNNNIFINKCDMTTGLRAVAFYKSTSALTNLGAGNNNNLFYTGTPGTKNLIYYDATNSDQTLLAFQGHMGGRELLSVTENVQFTSMAVPYNLHIPNGTTTVTESGGLNIAGITDDFDANIRQGNPGYAGTGVGPDIGADEFGGINPNLASTDMGATALIAPGATGCYTSTETVTVTIKNYGTSTIDFSAKPVTVTTNVTGAVTQTLTATVNTGTLAAGATQNVNMSTTLNMTTAGTYTFNASTAVTGDGNAVNDAMAPATRTVVASTTLPYTQNFDAGTATPAGWNTTGWTIGTIHANPSTGNGLYKEIWSAAPSGVFTLLKLGLVTATDNLKFDYRILNWSGYPATATPNSPAWGSIVINVSTDCGASFSAFATIDPTNHTEALTWATKSYSLASLAGNNVIFKFVATWAAGDYYMDFDNFEMQTPPACLAPTVTAATSVGSTTATINWTAPSPAPGSGYVWEVRTSGAGGSGATGLAQTGTTGAGTVTANVTSLSSGTLFHVYVESNCGSGSYSTWAGSVDFSTLQIPATLPFTEGFESGFGQWGVVNGTQTNQWVVGTAAPNSGLQSAYISNDGGTTNSYDNTASSVVHIYRAITFPPGVNPFNLKFNWKGVGETGLWDYFNVYIVPTTTTPVAGTMLGFGQVGSSYYNQSSWQTVNLELANATYAGQTMRLVFSWKNDGSFGTPPPAAIDNIEVTEILCTAPTGLTASAITGTTAAISWTASVSSPTNGYQWEVRTAGAGGSGSTGLEKFGTTGAGIVTANVTGLTGSTQYYLYVRSDCSSSFSTWAGAYPFATSCVAVTSLDEGFNGTTFPPACWSLINAGTGNQWIRTTSGTYEGAGAMRYSYNSASAANAWAFTPEISMTAGGIYYIIFHDKTDGGATYPEKLKVTVGDAATVAAQTTTLWDNAGGTELTNTSYIERVIAYTAPSTGSYYFAFNCYSDADMFYLYVDKIVIVPQPSIEMALTSLAQTSASLAPIGGNDPFTVTMNKQILVNGQPQFAAFTGEGSSSHTTNANNTVLLENIESSSKYPVTPVTVKAIIDNLGIDNSFYTLDWIVGGVAQPTYNGPEVTAGNSDMASLTYTPTSRGTFLTNGTISATGDYFAFNNSKSMFIRVYPDVFTRTGYDNGTNVVDTYIGWGSSTAMKAGVRFTATTDTKLAGVDYIFRTEDITTGNIYIQVRAAGTTTTAPGDVLYSKSFNTADYLPTGEAGAYITFPFGDDAPVIASGSDYWITIKTPTGILYPGGAQSTGITLGRSFIQQTTDTTLWDPLIITDEFAWMMRAVNVIPAPATKTINLKVLLEGPYTGPGMSTLLNPTKIPLAQPYSGAPWNYAGTESVNPIPADVVDWVLVDLRDAATAAAATPATRLSGWPKAFFLKSDGSIVGLDGTSNPDIGNPTVTNNLFVVVRHRNHIAVMSATGMTLSGSEYSYDFSSALTQAYNGGAGYKLIAAGVYGMVAGDATADGNIFTSDYTQWSGKYNLAGYLNSDFTMDGNVYTSDYTKWSGNYNKGNPVAKNPSIMTYQSQVPGDK